MITNLISIFTILATTEAHQINDRNHFDLTKRQFLSDNWNYLYRCQQGIYPTEDMKAWAGSVTWKNTPMGPSWVAENEFLNGEGGYYEYVAILGQDGKGIIDLKGFYRLTKKLDFTSGNQCAKINH